MELLTRDLKGEDVKWTEEFTHDEQFDVLMQTTDTTTGIQLFEMVNFEADPVADIILVKITGTYDPQYSNGVEHSELEVSFHMSASDVSYLAPGQTVRGAVSNDPDKYKIYEFFVNKMQFPEDTTGAELETRGVDLFVTLTACVGNIKFFISDDFKNLFTD